MDQVEKDERTANGDIANWINRREDTLEYLGDYRDLLTLGGRANGANAYSELHTLADCLDEASKPCDKHNAPASQTSVKLEKYFAKAGVTVEAGSKSNVPVNNTEIGEKLAEAGSNLKAAEGLVKEPTKPSCKEGDTDCVDKYSADLERYLSDLTRLDKDKAALAKLQSDDSTLAAGDATLQKLYAQVEKVALHVDPRENPGMLPDGNHLFQKITFQPNRDSDTTASVTCTSILDNSTTFGPVPITIQSRKWHPVFSVGVLFSLTPHQTLGVVPVVGSPTTYEAANTGYDHWQLIPFAYLTAPFPAFHITKKWKLRLGITGGVGFNPYSGVQGIDGFEGFSYKWGNIFIHAGIHDGRYEDIDPKSGITLNNALPPDFPTTAAVPTRTRFTYHPAFGISYSF